MPPFARFVKSPWTVWVTAPPRTLMRMPNEAGPVLWIVPVNEVASPSRPTKAPIEWRAGTCPP